MRLAVVTTPAGLPSGIGDYTRRLLPHLARHVDLEVFVAPGLQGETFAGFPTRSIEEIRPREFGQLLYQVGNERHHAFMLPLIRTMGGAVVLHDWILFDLAAAAFPELERGTLRGLSAALREGGVAEARVWWRNRMDRRAQRRTPLAARTDADLPGGLRLWGWHDSEPGGAWTADVAQWRAPAAAGTRLRLGLRAPAGRSVRLLQAGAQLARHDFFAAGEVELVAQAGSDPSAPWTLEVGGIEVADEQRRRGDPRRLGVFVRSIEIETPTGWSALDLGNTAVLPLRTVALARDRFALSLNRSVVRFADAFIVHSAHVAELVRTDRNAPTPIGLVRHGADPVWRSEDRRLERERLGLDAAWRESFLVTSFGAVQAHKRVDVLLAAVAQARRSRPALRLALVGPVDEREYDVAPAVRRLGLTDSVRITGRLSEEDVRRWIHAGDLGVQLRGPSTGGTSGGIFQTLAAGRGLIASALNEQKELPDECVFKLHPAEDEVARLAQKLVELIDAPAVRASMEQVARDFVTRECRWEVVAARYAELLERFPRPRASRRSLIAMRLEQAAHKGYARGRIEPNSP
jgi:glycosyltransferase involved in cell wall biosynthesis